MNMKKSKSFKKLLLALFAFFLISVLILFTIIYSLKIKEKRIYNEMFKNNIELCKFKVDTTVKYINNALQEGKSIQEIKDLVTMTNCGIKHKSDEILMNETGKIGVQTYNPIFIDSIDDGMQLVNIRPKFVGKLCYHDEKKQIEGDSLRADLIAKYKSFKNSSTTDTFSYPYHFKVNNIIYKDYKKISAVKTIDSLNWIVGCGFFVEDIEKIDEILIINTKNYVFYLFLLIILIMISTILLIRFIFKNFNKDIKSFTKYFNKISFTTEINKMSNDSIHFTEHKILTNGINNMISRYNEIRKYLETDNAIIIINEADEIKFINKKFKEYFEEKLPCIGKSLLEISNYEDIKSKLDEVRNTKRNIGYTVNYNNKWWKTTLYPLINGNGNVTDIILQDTDITELKQTQDKLFESKKLEQLGYVVRGISHELATPIGSSKLDIENTIANFEELSDNLKNIDSKLTERIRIKHNRIYKNLSFAGDLLDSYHNIAKDEMKGEKRTFNLVDKVNDIITSIKPRIEHSGKEIKIETFFKGKEDEVFSFPNAISQILFNLIINSLKHGYKDKEKGTIKIIVENTGKSILIKYFDDGIGIEEKEQQFVFDIFYTTNPKNSSGLGLSIIKRIIKEMNGTINLKNNDKGGVNFNIIIPAV